MWLGLSEREKSAGVNSKGRGSTSLLILSVFFPRLWLMDITSMSLFWVIRPWYRTSIRGAALKKKHGSLLDGELADSTVTSRAKRLFADGRKTFVAGLLCGGMIVGLVWSVSVWKTRDANLPSVEELFPMRSPSEEAIYDHCLVAQNGNTVACDAVMRIVRRGY
jgi:hypothetical protein